MKPRHRGPILAALALIPALALAGCAGSPGGSGSSDSGSGGSAKTPLAHVTLMLNFTYSGHHAPFFYGVQKGYFRDEGIDLKIEPGGGSLKTVQAVGAGHAEFGWSDAPSIITGISSGVPVHGLGAFEQDSSSAVMYLSDSGIKGPKGLEGKSVGLTPGDALSQTFPAFLAANDVPQDKVHIVNVSAASKIAVLAQGKVDAIVGFMDNQGPVVAEKSGKKVTSLLYSDYGVPFLGLGFFASNKTIKNKPDLVKKMYSAIVKSWKAADKNPKAAVNAMEKKAGEQLPSQALLLTQLKRDLPLIHNKENPSQPVGVNTEKQWQDTVNLLAKYGVIDNPKPVSTYWNGSSEPKAGS